MKTTLGCISYAKSNNVLTSFSLSPKYLLVNEDADILKKVHLHSVATAFAIIVFPVPGGPNRRRPRGGALKPLKRSGRKLGTMIISLRISLASLRPMTSENLTSGFLSTISDKTLSLKSFVIIFLSSSFGALALLLTLLFALLLNFGFSFM